MGRGGEEVHIYCNESNEEMVRNVMNRKFSVRKTDFVT
jgi:hypothetical protein